jgi:hypothetical protein
MIKICLGPLFDRFVFQAFVIRIMNEVIYVLFAAQSLEELSCQSGFSRTRASCNTYCDWNHEEWQQWYDDI